MAQDVLADLFFVSQEIGEWFIEFVHETAAGIIKAMYELLTDENDPSNLTVTPVFDDAILPSLAFGVTLIIGHLGGIGAYFQGPKGLKNSDDSEDTPELR